MTVGWKAKSLFQMTSRFTAGLVLALATASLVCAETFEFDGLIEPYRITKVGSPVAGVLATVDVERGDIVKKGQTLATLQSDVERATMDLARERARLTTTIKSKEEQLAFRNRQKDRIDQLYKKDALAFKEMDEVETNQKIAALELQEAYENQRLAQLEYARSVAVVERMTIRSPFNGVVVERLLSPGEYVENQPIMEIARIDPLNVEVILPVDLFGKVKLGMKATIVPVAFANEKQVAKITIIDRVVDAASGTFGMRLEIANPKNRLPSGLKCKVLLEAP